ALTFYPSRTPPPPPPTLFPYTTLFRSHRCARGHSPRRQTNRPLADGKAPACGRPRPSDVRAIDRGRHPERPARGSLRRPRRPRRSEEYTSELQSRGHLVCRLLLEKQKT